MDLEVRYLDLEVHNPSVLGANTALTKYKYVLLKSVFGFQLLNLFGLGLFYLDLPVRYLHLDSTFICISQTRICVCEIHIISLVKHAFAPKTDGL